MIQQSHSWAYTWRKINGSKGYMHPNMRCITVYNSEDIEATYMPIDRAVDKEEEEVHKMGFPGGWSAKEEMQVQFLNQEDTLEEGTETHSSILAWKIPQTEEPGRV